MYVPMLKNWDSEMRALRLLVEGGILPSSGIQPLLKIVEQDEAPSKRGWYKSLDKLDSFFSGSSAFVDYYRCDLSKYKQLDMEKIGRVRELSADPVLYLSEMETIASYANLTPVISIRAGVENAEDEAIRDSLIRIRQKNGSKALGLCVSSSFDSYPHSIGVLSDSDYLFLDIGEQPLSSQVVTLAKFKNVQTKAKTILLNSPRKKAIKNRDYEERGVTDLIDNSVREKYRDHGFYGFGDYAGLRDDLKLNIKNGGKACAAIFIYRDDINKFMVYMNPNPEDGIQGLRKLANDVWDDLAVLDPENTCIALNQFRDSWMNGNAGNYATWVSRTVVRYVQQIAESQR